MGRNIQNDGYLPVKVATSKKKKRPDLQSHRAILRRAMAEIRIQIGFNFEGMRATSLDLIEKAMKETEL